ncbi:hypothetical protein GV791_01505 [Nocardia cyriacigeorgica]|uniref:Uncharacterized protein n=1 Tax=Nocardia cyriacigeorgica TaxID=135487 RepID=A0A6P1CFS5_9NOCA|nr:hypothetical protein [Nocardia cyriacigeorgica]NEW31238.1 hypothetical protein [Nocardia cyriacigeorgica]
MSEYTWVLFSADEKRRIVLQGIESLASERPCPHCGNLSLRWYCHELRRYSGRAVMIEWCPECRRFATMMIESLSRMYRVSDPLDQTTLQDLIETKSPISLLWKLDDKWSRGLLPQKISPRTH